MSNSITYKPDSPNSQIRVATKRIFAGDTLYRGDIPDDVFDYLLTRPDFGADLDTYRKTRGAKSVKQPDEAETPIISTPNGDILLPSDGE